MIRDEEIKRLVNYAKGLGLKVIFSSTAEDSGYWTLDNSEITISKNNNSSKMETVLSFIHELGHAKHNIHEKDRRIDQKLDNTIDHLDAAQDQGIDSKRKHRKYQLENEIAGTRYWHEIYLETNMKFPIWRLNAAIDFDCWQYEVFLEKDKFPTQKEIRAKIKELKAKYKP